MKKQNLTKYIMDNNIETITNWLQKNTFLPYMNFNEEIKLAASYGRFTILKLLLNHPNIDPRNENNDIMFAFIKEDNLEAFKLLFEDPRMKNNLYLEDAVRKSFIHSSDKIFEYLSSMEKIKESIKKSSPKAYKAIMIRHIELKVNHF